MKPTKATKPKAPKKTPGAKGDGDVDRAGVNDPWQSALRAFVQDDNGKPLANLLRELPLLESGAVPIPFGVRSALTELLDPTSPANLYRFIEQPEPLSNENLIETLNRARKQELESKEWIEWKLAHEAANVERARLVKVVREKFGGRGTEEDERSLAEFAEESGDTKALEALGRERRARAKWTEKKQRSYAAVRLTTKCLSDKQCKLLDRNLNIMVDVGEAMTKGLRFSEATVSVTAKYGLTAETVGDICKEEAPGHWRGKR